MESQFAICAFPDLHVAQARSKEQRRMVDRSEAPLPQDEFWRICKVHDGVSIYQLRLTTTMTVAQLAKHVCCPCGSAGLKPCAGEFGVDFDIRGVSASTVEQCLLFDHSSELVIDVAPWIAKIYLEPLQLIRSASAEPVQAIMDPVYTNVCIICLDSNPPPVQCGCACRGDMGLAHIGCIIRSAEYYATRRGPKA